MFGQVKFFELTILFLLGAESADLGTTDDDDSSSDSGEDSFISNAG